MEPKSCSNCIHYSVCGWQEKLIDAFYDFWQEIALHNLLPVECEEREEILRILNEGIASRCNHYVPNDN